MTRTEGRTLAFELLYSLEIQKVENSEKKEQIELFLKENEVQETKVIQYIKDTVSGITKNEKKLTEIISENLNVKWDINRISKVNLVLLKLGIYEMLETKLPYKVVINEVVELAKKYGDDNSSFFVNGILANIIKKQGLE